MLLQLHTITKKQEYNERDTSIKTLQATVTSN